MPNPAWIPLVGSGFDDLARQRQWAVGRNDQVDAANLNRLAAAQQTQNSYLQQLSERQQQEIDRQAAAQQRADEVAGARTDQGVASAEERRRYAQQSGEALKQRAEDVAFRDKQLTTQKDEATAKFNFAQLQQEQKIKHAGEVHATQYAELTHDEEAAQKRLDDIQALNKTKNERLAELRTKKKPTAQETAELAQLPIELKTAQQQEKAASRGLEAISRAKVGRIASMSSQGFSPDDSTGKIVHEPTGQAFNFRKALKAAKESPAPVSDAGVPTIEGKTFADTLAPSPPSWVGAGTATGTNPPAPVAPPAVGPAGPDAATRWSQFSMGDVLGANEIGQEFSNPDEVKAAFRTGKLNRAQAKEILSQKFGMPLQ